MAAMPNSFPTSAKAASQGRVLVRYSGRLVPDFYVPPVIGTLVFRRSVETTFAALVDEAERRHRDGQPTLPGKQ